MARRLVLACSLALASVGCPKDPPAPAQHATPAAEVDDFDPGAERPALPSAGFARPRATPATDPRARELQSLFGDAVAAGRAGDLRRLEGLARGLYPLPERIGGALRPDAPPGMIRAVHAMYAAIKPPEGDTAAWARLFPIPSDRTEVRVYAATTEEIAANDPGGTVDLEFPREAVGAAKSVLAPGVRFFEVEVVKPGEDAGTKFHLLFHDGEAWRMLGPIWRVNRARKR